MSRNHVRYLLVGGGVASSAAAVAIRKRDPAGSILLVGQEINRPYNRPPLSKAYLRRPRGSHDDLFTLPQGWFAENHVEMRTGRRVAQLDTARSTAILNDGNEIAYDRLLLATGSTADHINLPGANLPNIFYFRTLDDADRLINAIEKAKSEGARHEAGRGKAAIIGGGILGIELAGSLCDLGLKVILVVGRKYPWAKFASEFTGKFIARHLQTAGIEVLNDTRATRLEGDGRVQRVVLDNGVAVDCDFAVAAVGSHANLELLRGTHIAAEKAILTNDRCQTSDANVYAAGDCAAIFDPIFHKHRIIDHWQHAKITGDTAGINMTGDDKQYDAVSSFTTSALDLKATVWGDPKLVDRSIVRGDSSFVEIGIGVDGRVARVLAIGDGHDETSLQRLVKQRVSVIGREEKLKDSSESLHQFVDS